MNEFLSFFRFVLPGIIYFGLCLSFVLINDHNYFFHLIKNLNSDLLIGFIGMFFVTGGIGYILSIIYRVFFPIHGIDQVELVNKLLQSDIEVHRNDDTRVETLDNSHRERIRAYEIINVLWHLNYKYFDADKTIFQASVINSMGAILMGCFASTITCTIYYFISPSDFINFNFIASIVLILFFTSFIWYQYIKSRNMYERWLNSTFISRVKTEKKNVKTEFVFRMNYFE